jgi:glycosyltransferase involved in cell wall biosynthesis
MLRDKGVLEFVAAATQLAPKYPAVEFALLGATDYNNPAAISGSQVQEWVSNGQVIYLGTRDDVRTEIARADCVVLPSYREGTPRTLLEAAAMAKPIVTTDTAGCREVVADGVNGFLCRVADAQDLADKLERMLMLDPGARRAMGLAGRLRMQEEFDEQLVIEKYRLAIEGATAAPPPR